MKTKSQSSNSQSADVSAMANAATKIKPVFDRIVVSRLLERETRGGIVLPDSAQGKSARGIVVACGTGPRKMADGDRADPSYWDAARTEAMPVQPGDVIVYKQYSGTDIEVDGHEFLIIAADDVLAVIE